MHFNRHMSAIGWITLVAVISGLAASAFGLLILVPKYGGWGIVWTAVATLVTIIQAYGLFFRDGR